MWKGDLTSPDSIAAIHRFANAVRGLDTELLARDEEGLVTVDTGAARLLGGSARLAGGTRGYRFCDRSLVERRRQRPDTGFSRDNLRQSMPSRGRRASPLTSPASRGRRIWCGGYFGSQANEAFNPPS